MKKLMLPLLFAGTATITQAQNVGFNATGAAPNASAMVDISSTTSGLLIPRMTTAQRAAIGSPATGLTVYDTSTGSFWYYNGTVWVEVGQNNGWRIDGNAGTVSGTNFVGTTDAQPLDFRTGNTIRFRIANGNQVQANADGTAAAPFYSWVAETGTGMYRAGTNTLGFSAASAERMRISNTEVTVNNATNGVGFRARGNSVNPLFNVNAVTNQVGFFINNSPYAVIRIETNASDASYPLERTINTNAASGTASVFVGRNDASGGMWSTGSALGATSSTIGLSGYATTTTASGYGGYFENDGAYAYVGGWQTGPWTVRKIVGNGTVNTIVDGNNGEKVVMTCPETPEVVFQDFGTGKLSGGKAIIQLDPLFSKNIIVDANHPLKVYIQLEGDCKGVFVTNKSDEGFEVVELSGGTSNVEFSWMVVANRADVEFSYSDGSTKVSEFSKSRFPVIENYIPPKSMNPQAVRTLIKYNTIKR